jgi:membrane-associated phospholipid phosphatase
MDSGRGEALSPPESLVTPPVSSCRRLARLISLVTGLVLFSIWLPAQARVALLVALRAQLPLVGMLLLFALVTLSLVWSAGQRLDTQAFLLLNLRGYHPMWLDRVMRLATQMGSLGGALVSAWLFFVGNYRRLAVETILGTITLWLAVETIKALTGRARPFWVLEGTRIVGWRERGRSFPSGHTAQAFFLVTLISRRFPLGMGGTVALYALATLVGVTRIYVGAHYPRDVIGGVMLGSVWAGLAALVDPYWRGLWF